VVKHYFCLAKGVHQAVVYFLRFNIRKHDPLRLKEDYVIFERDPSLKMIVSELVFYEDPAGAYAGPFMRAQLGRLFCMLFNREKTGGGQPGGLKPGQKKTVTSFIRSRIHKRFTIKELAESVNLNPDYFGRQFKISFKMSPQEWIKQERTRLRNGGKFNSGI
jgi:AraC-like DNA-binding protein